MGKFFAVIRLGIKYLYRYRRRYIFLLAALSFCFAIITFVTSTKDGMYENVYYAAQSHYAGDIVALAHDITGTGDRYELNQNEISAILNAASDSQLNPRYTVLRTMVFETGTSFFNGNYVPLRYLIGCDFENESFLFNRMAIDGEFFNIGDDGVILSSPTAELLGAKTGDSVILEIETWYGWKNTGQFIVKGIVQDVSIFGYYKAFVSRLSLNRLNLYDDESCSTIGFFFENPGIAEQKRKNLQNTLSQLVQTGPLIYHDNEIVDAREQIEGGRGIFLYSLPVYLSEISDLLDAMQIVAYFVYGLMLLILAASAAVTYRLIIHERSKEFGTMRTIGFLANDLLLVLFSEIIFLGIISMITGFILANIISWVMSFVSFSWFPSFEIFLKNGKLVPLFVPQTILTNIIIIFVLLLVLALFPSIQVVRKKLPSLLSGESL